MRRFGLVLALDETGIPKGMDSQSVFPFLLPDLSTSGTAMMTNAVVDVSRTQLSPSAPSSAAFSTAARNHAHHQPPSLLLPLAHASILFTHGTIIAFNRTANALSVLRNASLLVTDDIISHIFPGPVPPDLLSPDTEVVDITDCILTPGFIDTHRHSWQTAYKTLGSNTTLVEYFFRYDEFASAGLLTPEDVYLGQLAGIYEGLNAGVTTVLDHAHHTWSDETSKAGLRASLNSGARIFWCYAFHPLAEYPFEAQVSSFRDIATDPSMAGSSTVSLGIAYDTFHPGGNATEINTLLSLIAEFTDTISALTTHVLSGPWGAENTPLALLNLGILPLDLPIVFSHASLISAYDFQLLRRYNQHISITPESEAHYGQTNPVSHHIQDQGSLGIDTHFTFSGDILTQARIWLHEVRRRAYDAVLERYELPRNNPMSVSQAFLLATRQGGLALHRKDLGVIEVGAKADLVVWDGTSPSMLGWNDLVAAVMLHASVGDVKHVVVDGKWKKRDGKMADERYDELKKQFLASAKRLQKALIESVSDVPKAGDPWLLSGYPIGTAETADTLRGNGTGYGELFLDAGGS
ncbi:5-methylthioadenosine/S-adenosylhomocysteine deaminase [Podospora aff. communis PSN243]|uniref:5-methylthioadenosine/S-adenosylhomocysteine deaminase n=1 Tax=Podospora aff. communis PSN243 TaxID=3040156 RepID=A0AAV9G0X8_9PEZI|nr:5-methylthioadenosine/S-adenosylhomocysteine deaminase [Podospora aff. communis PSN243]